MKKFLLSFCILLGISSVALEVHAQTQPVFLHQVNGSLILTTRYDDIAEGTPYFNETYETAALLLFDGTVVENIKVRMNLLANEINYLDSAGREMMCTMPVKSVIFKKGGSDTSSIFLSQKAIDANREGWFQMLAKGNATLLKETLKEIKETTGFGQGKATRTIATDTRHYVYYNNQLSRVKKVEELQGIFKNEQFNAWWKANKKGGKTEEQLLAAVTGFNKL